MASKMFIIFLTILPCCFGKQGITSVSSGIYLEEVPTTVLYDTTFRLNFQLSLPSIPIFSMDRNCSGTKELCALYEKVQLVQQVIIEDIAGNQPYLNVNRTKKSTRGVLDFVGEIDHILFGIATDREVGDLHGEIKKIVDHDLELEEAIKSNQNYTSAVSKGFESFTLKWNKAVQDEMQTIRLQTQSNSVIYRKDISILANMARISNQNELFLFTITRTEMVASDCRNKMIPRQILPDEVLLKELAKLSDELLTKGYEIATTLNAMFKLPVADCVFGDSDLRVTVNVPVRRQEANYKIFKITAVPFQSNEDQCVVHSTASAIVIMNNTIISIDNSLHDKCSFGMGKLCQVPLPYESRSHFTECAKSLIQGSELAIKKTCILQCHRTNSTRITRIGSSKFIVTSASHIKVTCGDLGGSSVESQDGAPSFGASLFKLGCNCIATINGRIDLHPNPECKLQEVHSGITKLIPTHFLKTTGLIFNNEPVVLDDPADQINTNWHMELPVYNSTPPPPLNFSHTILSMEDENAQKETKDVSQFLWLFVITIYTILLSVYVLLKLPPVIRVSPVSLCFFLITLVSAETVGSNSFENTMWLFFKSIQYETLVFNVIEFCALVLFFVLTWKTYKYSKAGYQLAKTVTLNNQSPHDLHC